MKSTSSLQMKRSSSNPQAAMKQQSFPMKGGDGPHSYLNNSNYQRRVTIAASAMIQEAIAKKLDVKCFPSNPFRVADLGCSVGPNTFMAVQLILESVERKYLLQEEGLKSEGPEFQVFFNDHADNDFNTLFACLPTDRGYFACGVPGTFHGRLFPEASIHLMYSSYALQWLSKVPEELLDEHSAAWNRERIHFNGAADEVCRVYAAQFGRDMENFLSARAKELVVGGMIVLIMPGLPDGIPSSQIQSALVDLLEASLKEMVTAGLICEAQVDSFNLPTFPASQEHMRGLVEMNGCFSIERMELLNPASKLGGSISGEQCAMHLRAAMEGVVAKHFGSGIIDELFDTVSRKYVEFSQQLETSSREETHIFAVLKRK